ncbi:MAG: patatin-like phospholipase family protein, partial [Gemmatimonadota bacterium]
GRRVWVVMGGGGLKGLAHVGAWQAVEEAGLEPAGLVGCSIGALVGACVAGGMGWEDLVPLAFALRKPDIVRINRRAVLLNGIRQVSLFQGDPLREYIRRILPVADWDELRIPLQVNAVNLETGTTEWFGTGGRTDVPLPEAIYASAALPVFYPPARIDGSVYVDGGAEHSFPIQRAASLGATGIVGVDVGAGKEALPSALLEQGMLAIHQQIFSIMSWRKRTDTVSHWASPPLLFVRPRLEGYQTFDFDNVKYFLEEGYRAARAALMRGV